MNESVPTGVTVVPAPEDLPAESYPSLGLGVAKGDLVLLTTDSAAPQFDWNEILLHRLGMVAQSDVDPAPEPDGSTSEVGKPGA